MRDVRIYALVDPRDGRIRYVGKTLGTLRTRLRGHINDVARGRVYIPRHRWIWSLLSAGIKPQIVDLEVVPENEWQRAEVRWIDQLRSSGCDLLNATAGGDGLSSYKHRDDTRRRQSEAAMARYSNPAERERTGSSVRAALANPESRARLRMAAAARSVGSNENFRAGGNAYSRSAEGRQRTSARFKGRVVSSETRRKLSTARTGQKRSAASIAKTIATKAMRREEKVSLGLG